MYEIRIDGVENDYEYRELIKMFLNPEEAPMPSFTFSFSGDKNQLKREIYEALSAYTGKRPEWGILTGVRPVKLAGEILASGRDPVSVLQTTYLLQREKAELITEICLYQQQILGEPAQNSCSLYAGIPFCPTRCLYCSFTSNQRGESEIARYLDALCEELRFTAELTAERGLVPESVYIGGGTPTTLSASQLHRLLDGIRQAFPMTGIREFTVEAGRPDTITEEKLEAIRLAGADRISINPQSMKQRTLTLIGREHTPEDIRQAFRMAASYDFAAVNADIIAGLPEETPEDFADTLRQVVGMGPENVTVHTLAVKRASRLIEQDRAYHYRQGEAVREMLAYAADYLRSHGYRPYYLYRQKHMAGNFENIGWCLADKAGVYNIRIMEEHQTNIAMGAGGISKVWYAQENRLERIANVSNYEIYIERLSEMLQRKKEGIGC